jgi:phytoene dehydrogenase-like protein
MEKYDVVIIGGGMGGITAANACAKQGLKTLVLEQNHHTGGNMSGFRRKGFYFDGGDQSFESLGIVFPILEELDLLDKVRWTKARFRMVSPDFDFFVDSFDNVEEALKTAFPEEKGISVLFKEVREVSRFIESKMDPWNFPLLQNFSFGRLASFLPWLPKLRRWLTFDYRVKACSVIRDPGLRKWFTDIGYYHMPFIFFAGFWHLWMKDYWYPEGGMQSLHDLLAENFTRLGGDLRCNTKVEKIEHAGAKALSAVTSRGETCSADNFIYAGDYKRLVHTILGTDLFKPAFVKKIQRAKLTESLVNVYLGVGASTEELDARLGAQHVFYFPNYDVHFPSARSPEDIHSRMWLALNHFGKENAASAPPGISSLVLQTYSSCDWAHNWGIEELQGRRSEEYSRLKKKVAGELTELAENLLPGLEGRILYSDVGTPISSERFSLNTEGSSGGWCYDDRESPVYRFPFLNLFSTPLKNLKTCGHYSLWPGGVITAALSGKIVANLSSGRKPLAKL